MAEIFDDEFDAPTPLKAAYCSQLSMGEYELQGSETTRKHLQDLLDAIQQKPELYTSILEKRAAEDEDMLTFLKKKVFGFWSSEPNTPVRDVVILICVLSVSPFFNLLLFFNDRNGNLDD